MPLDCAEMGCSVICEFPYVFDNATNGCASAAQLLGDTFTSYNLAYTWATALLLFGFVRSWLFNLREHNWHFVSHASVLLPLLCTIAQFLAIIEASNLHMLRWSTRVWTSLAYDLFFPCAFSVLLVYVDDARPRPQRRNRLYNVLLHAAPWSLGLVLSVIKATMPISLAEGVSYVYIVPFVGALAADVARFAWTLRAAPDYRSLRSRFMGV
jgi:hypothetical protein